MKTFLCLVMLGFVKLQGSEKTEHLGDDLEPASNPRLRIKGPGTGTTADWNFCSADKPCGHGQGDCDGNSHCKPGLECGRDNCGDYNKDAHSFADCCVDPDYCGMAIYGPSFGSLNPANGALGPLAFSAYHVVTNEEEFWYKYDTNRIEPSYTNYWITADAQTGTDGQLHMDFACTQTITGFQLKNTHNGPINDRGTKKFSILICKSQTSKCTQVVTGTLPDARNVSPVPLLTFNLDRTVRAEKVIFQIDSYYGLGGGLQYFATY